MKEECGVFGVYLKGKKNFKRLTEYIFTGLLSLQHRGQEASGIALSTFYNDKYSFDTDEVIGKDDRKENIKIVNDNIKVYKAVGVVNNLVSLRKWDTIYGKIGIGHTRYSTKGASSITNAQPITIKYFEESMAIAHNGNIENSKEIKEYFMSKGTIFLTNSDTELFGHVLVKNLKKQFHLWSVKEVAETIFNNVMPSFSLLLLFKDRLIAMRDPMGVRPLFMYENSEGFFFSSEDSSFKFIEENVENDDFDFSKVKEIKPGEIVEVKDDKVNIFSFSNSLQILQKSRLYKKNKINFCFFEFIYFARPDSNFMGLNVHKVREDLGRLACRAKPVDADIVIPVMDSGLSAAIGYSKEAKIQLEIGLIKNKYIGRTFIAPDQKEREKMVFKKLSPIPEVIKDKDIILIDDSIVRGTTMKKIVTLLKNYGAKKVHVRIASPKVLNSCFWGIDIPDRKKLIAYNFDEKGIAEAIGADSVGYVPLESIIEYLNEKSDNFCFYCFKN